MLQIIGMYNKLFILRERLKIDEYVINLFKKTLRRLLKFYLY